MWTKPKSGGYTPNADTEALNEGMDLRDYFAGQALAGMFADTDSRVSAISIAGACYSIADAMMQARSK